MACGSTGAQPAAATTAPDASDGDASARSGDADGGLEGGIPGDAGAKDSGGPDPQPAWDVLVPSLDMFAGHGCINASCGGLVIDPTNPDRMLLNVRCEPQNGSPGFDGLIDDVIGSAPSFHPTNFYPGGPGGFMFMTTGRAVSFSPPAEPVTAISTMAIAHRDASGPWQTVAAAFPYAFAGAFVGKAKIFFGIKHGYELLDVSNLTDPSQWVMRPIDFGGNVDVSIDFLRFDPNDSTHVSMGMAYPATVYPCTFPATGTITCGAPPPGPVFAVANAASTLRLMDTQPFWVTAGGTDPVSHDLITTLYGSADNGATFTPVTLPASVMLPAPLSSTPLSVIPHPTDPQTFVIVQEQGTIYGTHDGGKTFREIVVPADLGSPLGSLAIDTQGRLWFGVGSKVLRLPSF
ncbi:MAG: Sortilin, neurotensin receptor 3 [Myxococcaceae bacterium]|nr:Sortilin, neurotensin receptor 3 [Myxococcaceae bacterium]